MARVPVIAVNIEVKIPIVNVTANPLIGPVPIINKATAAINVVTLESTMVANARS